MINDALALYFVENDDPEVTPGTLWEAHKAFVRGKFIELGSRKKKESTHLQSQLIKEIEALERQHKVGLQTLTFQALTQKGEELKELFHLEQKQWFRMVAQSWHEWGNKPGRLLACSLQQKKICHLHC